MQQIENVNIVAQDLLPTPNELQERYPVGAAGDTVHAKREEVKRILTRADKRMLVVVGPCSIHDLDAATEYAERLKELSEEVSDQLCLIMRVYFEKPRTSIGWKGFINDPNLDDSFNIHDGLGKAREFLVKLGSMGIGVGTEALDPITPQYIGDLVSWVAIGARTSESQTHRDMASGLSAPVGFKNGTDGNVEVATNALKAVMRPQHFLGVTGNGRCAVFHTKGNRYAHMILRGGSRPNYDSVSVAMCERALVAAGVGVNIVIDCSHGNSLKQFEMQPIVLKNCVNQIRDGNESIIGVMLESNLHGGKQALTADRSQLKRGVSITDGCIDWDTTVSTLKEMAERLKDVLPTRSCELNTPPPSQVGT